MEHEALTETIRRCAWLLDYYRDWEAPAEQVHSLRILMERAKQQLEILSTQRPPLAG
jgi:hypothetical protein